MSRMYEIREVRTGVREMYIAMLGGWVAGWPPEAV